MHTHLRKQQGAALVISLLILLALTIIGVTGLSNTGLEERMAYNYQQTTLVFQAAESAIGRIALISDPESPLRDADNDPLETAAGTAIGDTSTVVTYNDTSTLPNATIATSTTLVLMASANCAGDTIGGTSCLLIDARANASVTETNAQTMHTQRFKRKAPGGAVNNGSKID